jgi:hypothetical protein
LIKAKNKILEAMAKIKIRKHGKRKANAQDVCVLSSAAKMEISMKRTNQKKRVMKYCCLMEKKTLNLDPQVLLKLNNKSLRLIFLIPRS